MAQHLLGADYISMIASKVNESLIVEYLHFCLLFNLPEVFNKPFQY